MGRRKTDMNKRVYNLIELIKSAEELINGNIMLDIKNLETGENGCACYTDRIKQFGVYEGAEDGSDDKSYSIEEFANKYEVISINIELDEEIEEEF